MKNNHNFVGLAGGTVAFTAVAVCLSLAAGFAFTWWMIPNALLIGVAITGGGLGLTRLFGRSVKNTLCFTLSCIAAGIAFFLLVTIRHWNELAPEHFLGVGIYGLVAGLAGSVLSRLLARG